MQRKASFFMVCKDRPYRSYEPSLSMNSDFEATPAFDGAGLPTDRV